MKTILLADLPVATRDRLRCALKRRFELVDRSIPTDRSYPPVLLWTVGGGALGCLAFLLVPAAMYFGWYYQPWDNHDEPVKFGLACLVVAAVVVSVVRQAMRRDPIDTGVFVFPRELLDIGRKKVVVYPLSELTKLHVLRHQRDGSDAGAYVVLEFGAKSYRFQFTHTKDAMLARDTFEASREQAAEAAARGNVEELAALSVLLEARPVA